MQNLEIGNFRTFYEIINFGYCNLFGVYDLLFEIFYYWNPKPDTFSPLSLLVADLLGPNRYDTTILRSFYTFLKTDFGKKQ